MTVREALAGLLLLCATACAARAGFLVHAAAGFGALALCLGGLGLLLGYTTLPDEDDGE